MFDDFRTKFYKNLAKVLWKTNKLTLKLIWDMIKNEF